MSLISPPPLANWGALKAEVLKLISAEQDDQAVASVDTWCRMALLDCFDRIRPYWAIRAATITIDEDSVTLLPPSYIGMNGIYPVGGGKALQAVSIEQAGMVELQTNTATSYLIEGTSLTILPRVGEPKDWRLSYYSELGPLIDPADTNAWITRAGAACMFRAASYAMEYQENDTALMRYESAFGQLAEQITNAGIRARSGTGMVVRMER